MLPALQAAVVSHLRDALATSTSAGRPKAIRPYAGELLNPAKLLNTTPVVLVDLAGGDIEAVTEGEDTSSGFALDLICCARNAASHDAAVSASTALLGWVLDQMRGALLDLDGGGDQSALWTHAKVRPILRAPELSAFALQILFEVQ
ncbi:MAG: hypothetical protein IAE99_08250 [Rhodothermales bacterium]|nr:hypothetical protein [Rhodothermales bacterium]